MSSAAAERVRRLLWTAKGARRVPAVAAFDHAVSRLRPGDLERICEFNPWGPIYLIPTRPFLTRLARTLRRLGARRVVEVAAGDGHLSHSLSRLGVPITATDSGRWERPEARMSPQEKRALRGSEVAGLAPGANVVRLEALEAIRKLRPDLVIACWIPPGPLLSRIIRAAPRVLEIGAGSGITGDIRCWRYEHEFLEDLDARGRCRLDERPANKLHTRVTLYTR